MTARPPPDPRMGPVGKPPTADAPYPGPRPETLQDLRDAVASAPDIEDGRRKRILGDINRFVRSAPVAALRLDGRALRPYVERLGTVVSGFEPKRGRNMRSSLNDALRWRRGRWDGSAVVHAPLSPAWAALYAKLTPNSTGRHRLARFIRFCSAASVPPTDVSDATLAAFLVHLEGTDAVQKSRTFAQHTAQAWCMAVKDVPGWPDTPLSLSPLPRPGVPRTAYASEFLADVEAFLKILINKADTDEPEERFDEENGGGQTQAARSKRKRKRGRNRASAAATRERQMRRAASLLAEAKGLPLSEITSLPQLVQRGNAQAILSRYIKVLGRETISVRHLAVGLEQMALRHLPGDTDAHRRMRNLVDQTDAPPSGLSEKNEKRLDQIGTRELKALYTMPAELVDGAARRAREGTLRRRDLVDAQVGVAVAILLEAPLRIKNLTMMLLGVHLILPAAQEGGGEGKVSFPGVAMKGHRPITLPIGPDVVAVLRVYLDEVLPRAEGRLDDRALFPGRVLTSKREAQFGTQISRRIKRRLGLDINPHLFRSLVAYLHLVRRPNEYHVVQILLGHASVETTKRYYCGAEEKAALAHVQRCMAELKAELAVRRPAACRNAAGRRRG